ncbi:MAG: glutaminyl-peptide cyclotransferase, partial [Luminiphilus sp.]
MIRSDGYRLGVFCLVSALHWGALAGAPVVQQPVTAESGTTATANAVTTGEVTHYDYRVISKVRFDRENFTQGLEIHEGRLYVSSGLYGRSMVRVYDFPSLELMQSVTVDPRIFAEGLTIIDDRLVLLSWRERVMLVYQLPDMTLIG